MRLSLQRGRAAGLILLAVVMTFASVASAQAATHEAKPCPQLTGCWVGGDGAGASAESDASTGSSENARVQPHSEVTLTPACPGNDPNIGGPYDRSCALLTTTCGFLGEGDGPMTWIWRRPLAADGTPSGVWVKVGHSCNQPLPGQAGPSLADVRRAFREVDFARPRLASQPQGGWALVNLDTYYAVSWPEEGVAPGQVATVRLLGHTVAIRPKVVEYEYDFGDGRVRRTSDAGGPYPDGNVRHLYRRVGPVTVGVTARYSADFSVDGSGFRALDDTVRIAGPTRELQVYEARARLVPNPGEE